MPNFDRLAKRAVNFTRAYCNCGKTGDAGGTPEINPTLEDSIKQTRLTTYEPKSGDGIQRNGGRNFASGIEFTCRKKRLPSATPLISISSSKFLCLPFPILG